MQAPDLPYDQVQRMERDMKYFIRGMVPFGQIKRWIQVQEDEKTAKYIAEYLSSKLNEELMTGWENKE